MDNISTLYRLNIEIEGILRVIEQHDSNEARELLAEKFKTLSQGITNLLATGTKTEPSALPDNVSFAPCTTADAPNSNTETPHNTASEKYTESTGYSYSNATQHATAANHTVKLDEMLSARQSADLSKAFTLNDKYRFRRELFGGSDSDFGNTVSLVSTMESFDEARDYLLRDLCWDPKNEAVEDFLTIIRRHFQA